MLTISADSPLITKPSVLVPAAMADNSMALVLSFLPGLDDLIVGAYSADPSGKRSAGKSYVVFGKKNNTNAIELSAIQHTIYLHLIYRLDQHDKPPQSNHLIIVVFWLIYMYVLFLSPS
jgi:hypothetical protein